MSGNGNVPVSDLASPVPSPAPSPAAVNCVVSNWVNQGTCSKFCGPGTQTQTRTVRTPASNGGTVCPALTQTVPCNLRDCHNVNCAVSNWAAFDASGCTSTTKSKTRTRTVSTAKVDYGTNCPALSESQPCTSTDVASASAPINPTFICSSGYIFDATKPVGQKCVKGTSTVAEMPSCPTGYSYNPTLRMCTKLY